MKFKEISIQNVGTPNVGTPAVGTSGGSGVTLPFCAPTPTKNLLSQKTIKNGRLFVLAPLQIFGAPTGAFCSLKYFSRRLNDNWPGYGKFL